MKLNTKMLLNLGFNMQSKLNSKLIKKYQQKMEFFAHY
jgi:hypothetical protein